MCVGCRCEKDKRFDLSLVAEHVHFNKHAIDWENRKVIQKEQQWHSRKVKEALLVS